MLKTLTAGITALSLTLGSAAPSQAQGLSEDDIGKILFGLATLAVIGKIVDERADDNNRNRSVEVTRTHRSINTPQVQRTHRPRVDRTVLPRDCLRGYETRFGTHRMFSARCLRNNYAFADHLPRGCSVRIFTTDGARRGFDPACLRGQGYTARR